MKKKFLIPLMATALLAMTGVVVSCGGTKPETGEKTGTDQKPGENQGENNPGGNQGGNQGENNPGGQTNPGGETKEKIVLSATKTTILVGETVKITSSVEGVTFEAKDDTVISIDAEGNVTGLKAGSSKVNARKEGYSLGSITITVEKAPAREAKAVLEFEFADHYTPQGVWGFPAFGMSFDTPVEEAETASGGKAVGWFNQGCKETITFTSDKSGKIELGLMLAYNAEVQLSGNISVKVNNVQLDMTGKVCEGPETEGSYYDFHSVDFKDVEITEGENKLVVECIGSQGVNMDCVNIYTEGYAIEQVKPVVLPKVEATLENATIVEGQTATITVEGTGYTFESDNPKVATVDENGLITAVAAGNAKITISKEGYRPTEINVTVKAPVASFEELEGAVVFEFEDATHHSPDGLYGGGWGSEATDSPVEDSEGSSGGKSIGNMKKDCTETIKFNASADGKVKMNLVGATTSADWSDWNNIKMKDMDLGEVCTITVNGESVKTGGRILTGCEGQVYNNWVEVSFGEVSVIEGENTFVLTITANQGPNFDCLKILGLGDVVVQK